tara:strand:+ start:305 stop:649 length:345 start_codon:yes stop_codon:yes gene_type:complete
MEAITTPTPNITPTPSAVAPTPIPTPDVATPLPMTMENGGATPSGGNSSGSFFGSLNWLEVSFSILGVAALSYVIYYYRYKLKQDKLINNELQRQIDELKMNMQTNMKGKYKTI